MGVLYLVRHGQADPSAYGVGDDPPSGEVGALTGLGVRQARSAGVALRARTPVLTAAVSGELPRQRQTLTELLGAFAEPPAPQTDPGWDEYPMPAAVRSADPALYRDSRAYQDRLDTALSTWIDTGTSAGDDETETYPRFRARITAAAERAAQTAGPGAATVVVSSAGVISQLVADLWGVSDSRWPELARTMVNASITTVLVGRRGSSVLTVNEHTHLLGEAGAATFR